MLTDSERQELVEELAEAIHEARRLAHPDSYTTWEITLKNHPLLPYLPSLRAEATACLPNIERLLADRDLDLSGVTRVVVVTDNGREFDSKGSHGGKGVQLSIQDGGQTLKVLPAAREQTP